MQVSYKPYSPAFVTQPTSPRIAFGVSQKTPSEQSSEPAQKGKSRFRVLAPVFTLILGAMGLSYMYQDSPKIKSSLPTKTPAVSVPAPKMEEKKPKQLKEKQYDGISLKEYIQKKIQKTKTDNVNILAQKDLCNYFHLKPQAVETILSFMAKVTQKETYHAANVAALLYLSSIVDPVFIEEDGKVGIGLSYNLDPDKSLSLAERRKNLIEWILKCADNGKYREIALTNAFAVLLLDDDLNQDPSEKDKPKPQKKLNGIDI